MNTSLGPWLDAFDSVKPTLAPWRRRLAIRRLPPWMTPRCKTTGALSGRSRGKWSEGWICLAASRDRRPG